MNVRDIINHLADRIEDGTNPNEAIGDYINLSSFDVHTAILDEIGEVDLSEPRPDLSEGWTRVREQLAYNALSVAVCAALNERGSK